MFLRVMASPDARLPLPLRAGAGFIANLAPDARAAETDETLTVANISGGLVHQGTTLTSDVIYTLPTAALIAAEFDTMDVGDAFSFAVNNAQAAAFDVVIGAGVGNTAVGANNSLSVPPQSTRIFTLVKTAAATFDLY